MQAFIGCDDGGDGDEHHHAYVNFLRKLYSNSLTKGVGSTR